jgi:hypothetical protein
LKEAAEAKKSYLQTMFVKEKSSKHIFKGRTVSRAKSHILLGKKQTSLNGHLKKLSVLFPGVGQTPLQAMSVSMHSSPHLY